MQKLSGLLLFLAGFMFIMGIIIAEIFYPPGYSTARDMISTLGSTPPPDSSIYQPSAAIFDTTMSVSGMLIMIGAYFMHQAGVLRSVTIAIAFLGLGAFAVGVFPAFHAILHPFAALVTFLSGGIAALLSAKITTAPFRYLAVILGVIVLIFLFLGIAFPMLVVPVLGRGGAERLVAYPLIAWLVGYGGYLMHGFSTSKTK